MNVLTATSRLRLEEVLKKRFFFAPAFAIYGGVAGLFDLGPPGCALQNNIIHLWRQHFVIEEGMLELDTTVLTPHDVLKTSGHVDRFTDYMVKDTVTNEYYRADHVLKAHLEKIAESSDAQSKQAQFDLTQLEGYSKETLEGKLQSYNVLSENGNPFSNVMTFNLMFGSDIGPTGALKGYLRPETAQGQFVNFKRLLECNYDKMPFASAQIGKSFRNEISPRAGLMRVREFTMAEVEHYVHPENKKHAKFGIVEKVVLPLLSRGSQEGGSDQATPTAIGDAVSSGMVNNQTLGYFLVRIYLFLTKIGIDKSRIRFRQHQANEMAHYASDCWDAEILSSYGWVECVGCADRAAYDLSVHSARTREKLIARERFDQPKEVDALKVTLNKKNLGIKFGAASKPICEYLESLDESALESMRLCLEKSSISVEVDGKPYELMSDMVQIATVRQVVHQREYIPSVIEPSFGLGRILYSLLEHVYWRREEDDQRVVLSFPPVVAPSKCIVVSVTQQDDMVPIVHRIASILRKAKISSTSDISSTSIGKKYARSDEVGTPYGITVDHQTLQDNTVTIRERDSLEQVRVKIDDLVYIILPLVDGESVWGDITQRFQKL